MKKNSLKIKKLLVNILIDHKIRYRETDKSIIVPFENGGNVDREPIWFKNFRIKQEAFNTEVIKRLDSLEYKVDAILECPTIKKEIKI